jgi:hypothetical protein
VIGLEHVRRTGGSAAVIGHEHVRAAALSLPDAYEEAAWVGTRWRVRGRTFAHLLEVDGGKPAGYARALGSDGPATVLMFRSGGAELDALRNVGPPFFAPVWRGDEVGLVVGDGTDWQEVRELVTESYCVQAPKRLAAQVQRPGG